MKKDFSPELEKLYEKYRKGIKEIAGAENENSRKAYCTYKKNGGKLFCSLQRLSKFIRINLKLNNIEVLGDHADGCIDYEEKNQWGTATHYVKVSLDNNGNDNSNYDYIIEQVRRTYEHAD